MPRLLALIAVTLVWGCATPIRPSGGPVDSTPPQLAGSVPESGSVNVSADQIEIHFSERLDESTVARSVTLSPQFSTPPEIRARGDRIEVVLPDSLRSATTYVVTIGTELRDEHGVALPAPITFAFSTGPVLDSGEIYGQLVDPETRLGSGGIQILAYYVDDAESELPDPGSTPPSYQTETATDGAFRLEYLRDGLYDVIGLRDRNRNRLADNGEQFAVSRNRFQQAAAQPDSSSVTSEEKLTMYIAERDTTAPQLRSIRALSNQRFQLDFNEPLTPIHASNLHRVQMRTNSGVADRSVESIYQLPGDSSRIYLKAENPIEFDTLIVELDSIAGDYEGNTSFVRDTLALPSMLTPDTLAYRFQSFLPSRQGLADSVLLIRPDQTPGVQFNQPLTQDQLQSRVEVIGPQGPLSVDFTTGNGTSYWISVPNGSLPNSLTVAVTKSDSVYTRRYSIPAADALGSISGSVLSDGSNRLVVHAFPDSGEPYTTHVQSDGQFAFPQLEPGTYRLRIHEVLDDSNDWFGGQLFPWRPPGILIWYGEPIRVRARWEHQIEESIDLTGM